MTVCGVQHAPETLVKPPGTKHAVPSLVPGSSQAITRVLQELTQAWSLSLAAHHAADTSSWRRCPFALPLLVCTLLELGDGSDHPHSTSGGTQLVLGSLRQQHSLLLAGLIALSVGDSETPSQQKSFPKIRSK